MYPLTHTEQGGHCQFRQPLRNSDLHFSSPLNLKQGNRTDH